MRLLLVDDDELLMEALSSRLSSQRYVIDIATKGDVAWEFISLFTYDLVVLDRMLPNVDGVTLCQRLRAQGHSMPILMLTARGDNADIIDGLNAGADDYVVKPFHFDQLVARIHALLRRSQEALPPILRWGDLSLNPDTLEVMNGDRPLNLTPKEYAILELLLRSNNHVFTIDAIIDRIWAFDPPADSAVRTHIKCLRQKLKAANVPASMIETVYGVGYRLTPPPHAVTPQEKRAKKEPSVQMAEVFENFKAMTYERISVLERAATALKVDELSRELHQQASSSAHKLAGSLGSFGFPAGSIHAKAIEGALTAQALSTAAAKQQFYQNLNGLRQVVCEQVLDKDELPLLLIIGDKSELTQALVEEARTCKLNVAIATSFLQAKAIIETDDPAIFLLNLSFAPDSSAFEILERLHHQAPSRPIMAIADHKSLTERLDLIHRGARTLLSSTITPPQAIAAVTQRLKQTGAGAKVLVVDDDPYILKKIQISLASWGFEISTLDDPHAFLTVLDSVEPDLLVLDIDMPEINGLELCQILRSEPRWNPLPVIFLSVHQDVITQRQAFAIGADDYIEKPVIGADLANRILNRLARS